ncbi:MAG: hypothetical protein J0M12_10525 [Deltaproteobacteria bacterium]|nr:hypothetical protein [Deltaproteobacteria bacterium]
MGVGVFVGVEVGVFVGVGVGVFVGVEVGVFVGVGVGVFVGVEVGVFVGVAVDVLVGVGVGVLLKGVGMPAAGVSTFSGMLGTGGTVGAIVEVGSGKGGGVGSGTVGAV